MKLRIGDQWYAANKKELMLLNSTLLEYPIIKEIDPGTSFQYVPHNKEFTEETVSIYKMLEKKCVSIGVKCIIISRHPSSSPAAGKLISIRYLLSNSGLAVSGGRALSVEYMPDSSAIARYYGSSEYIVKPLDETGWILVDYCIGR